MIEVDLPPEGSLISKTDCEDCGKKNISVHAKKYTHPKTCQAKKVKEIVEDILEEPKIEQQMSKEPKKSKKKTEEVDEKSKMKRNRRYKNL